MVPSEVDFLYRTSWAELKASGWVRRNVVEDPLHPSIDPKRALTRLRPTDREYASGSRWFRAPKGSDGNSA